MCSFVLPGHSSVKISSKGALFGIFSFLRYSIGMTTRPRSSMRRMIPAKLVPLSC